MGTENDSVSVNDRLNNGDSAAHEDQASEQSSIADAHSPSTPHKPRQILFTFGEPEFASPHGGQLLVEAVCRRFGIWKCIQHARPGLATSPFTAEGLFAQLLFSFTMGGKTLGDAGHMGRDSLLLEFLGLKTAADHRILESWLKSQTEKGVRSLWRTNCQLVRQILRECFNHPEGSPAEFDVAFRESRLPSIDDTASDSFWSWQTLAVGPFLMDGIWSAGSDGTVESGEHLPRFIKLHRDVWENAKARFCFPDATHNTRLLRAVSEAGFASWTVELHRNHFGECEQQVVWIPLAPNQPADQQYGTSNPNSRESIGIILGTRRGSKSGPPDQRRYLIASANHSQSIPDAFIEHDLGTRRTSAAENILNDFGLDHPPFSEIYANAALAAIKSIAYNILVYLKTVVAPPHLQCPNTRDVIVDLLMAPMVLVPRPGRRKVYIYFRPDLLVPCRKFVEESLSRRGRGRLPWWTMSKR